MPYPTDSSPVEFRGVPFERGRVTLIVPELSLLQLEDFSGRAKTEELSDDPDIRKAYRLDVIHAALKNNYPEVTAKEVNGFFTVGNLQAAYMAGFGADATSKKVRAPGE